MEICTLNDLLPNGMKAKKITTGSELLFAYELDKYARLILDKKLTLKGINIAKQLYSQAEFSFVVVNGLDVGFEVVNRKDTLMDISTVKGKFFTDTVQGVEFKSKTDKEWVYDFNFNVRANRVCYGMNRSAAYVSLVAYMIIDSLDRGVPCPKLVIDHPTHPELSLEYVDLLILQSYGNKWFRDLVKINFNERTGNQPTVEAFTIVNRQRGYMNREYTAVEKCRFTKKNFEVGDIVLLYTRKKAPATKVIRHIESCYPATITNITDKEISFVYYPNTNTELTHVLSLSQVEEEYGEYARTKGLISTEDYTRFPVCNVSYDFIGIGADLCTYLENKFFIRPLDFDGTYQYFRTQEGYDRVFLDTPNTIYALFEDRRLWYSEEMKEKFVDRYFTSRKRTPIYEEYRPWMK